MSPAGPGPDRTHWQGEPVSVWERLLGIPRLEVWSSLPSTNDRGRALVREGAPPWTVVVAEAQSAGRGRAGSVWQSTAGAGLWISVVLRPRTPAHAGLLPLLTGVALARALEAEDTAAPDSGLRVGLKWPNDVWLDGRKVAGILCESVREAVVAGVGVNVREPAGGYAPEHASKAGALEALTSRAWSEARILEGLLREWRALWDAAPLRFEGRVADYWSARDILRGRLLRVGAVEGVARGLTPQGALVLETPDGERTSVTAGHVEWRDDPERRE